MKHDWIHGQTDRMKEMKFSYTPNILVDAGSPMGRRAQTTRVPSPTGLDIALKYSMCFVKVWREVYKPSRVMIRPHGARATTGREDGYELDIEIKVERHLRSDIARTPKLVASRDN